MTMAILLFLITINLSHLLVNLFTTNIHYETILLVINTLLMTSLLVFDKQKKSASLTKTEQIETAINLQADIKIDSELLIKHFPDFLCIKDNQGRWLSASDLYLKIFNLQGIDYKGKTDTELFNYSDSNAEILKVSFIKDKRVWQLKKTIKESKIIVLNKQKVILETTITPIFDDDKSEINLIIMGHVVTHEHRKNNKLELLPQAFESCPLNLVFLNKKFQITEANKAFSSSTGRRIDELIGQPISSIIKGELALPEADFFAGNPYEIWSEELICLSKNGINMPIRLYLSSIIKNGSSVAYFASFIDISQQKKSEKTIIKLSSYDALTGLANRALFFDKLRQFILSASRLYDAHVVVFLIDLDRFKKINQSLGNNVGDELLKVVASRLQSLISANDIVARISGDEFAVLMVSEQSYEQTVYAASIVAGNINKQLSELVRISAKQDAVIGSSIGISIFPEDCCTTEEKLKADALLKNADTAKSKAKTQGKNTYYFFNENKELLQDKLLVELNLRKAIEKGELQLYYQPQYQAFNNKLCGAEVLVRWLHNNEKMIPPDQFIGIAEDTGLIIEIGYWILLTACKQMKKWLNAGYLLPQISVNVSAQQFNDVDFLGLVQKALNESGLDAKNLELELTESMLIGDARFVDLQLKSVKKMGIKLALDDFGTGYSSLSYLKNFPIDALKMDQSFVRDMMSDVKNSEIACAIIEIGHSLEQVVIAEGVETQEQFDFLRKNHCDIIQGYYFSKPLDTMKMTSLLQEIFGDKKEQTFIELDI